MRMPFSSYHSSTFWIPDKDRTIEIRRAIEKIAQDFSSHSRSICDRTRERGTASLPTAEINAWAIAERKERSIKIGAGNENRGDEERRAAVANMNKRDKASGMFPEIARIRNRMTEIDISYQPSTVFVLVFVRWEPRETAKLPLFPSFCSSLMHRARRQSVAAIRVVSIALSKRASPYAIKEMGLSFSMYARSR